MHLCLQARKLGSLLKEAERGREDLQGELSGQVLEVERSKTDMAELLQHNAKLQKDSEEHQALKGAYNALLHRSEAAWIQQICLNLVYPLVLDSLKNALNSALCVFSSVRNIGAKQHKQLIIFRGSYKDWDQICFDSLVTKASSPGSLSVLGCLKETDRLHWISLSVFLFNL